MNPCRFSRPVKLSVEDKHLQFILAPSRHVFAKEEHCARYQRAQQDVRHAKKERERRVYKMNIRMGRKHSQVADDEQAHVEQHKKHSVTPLRQWEIRKVYGGEGKKIEVRIEVVPLTKEDQCEDESRIVQAQCPMPNAQCPMPNAPGARRGLPRLFSMRAMKTNGMKAATTIAELRKAILLPLNIQ
jgi:hypothetical protein